MWGKFLPLVLALGASAAAAQAWSFKGVVASGDQCDAARGVNNRIHLVTGRYYQFDANGNKVADETCPAADQALGTMDYNPGIAVDAAGNVHIVTRRNGNWTSGFELWYARRAAVGTWTSYKAAAPMKRNYQVAIAAAANGSVYMTHGMAGDNVWGPVKVYRENGGAMQFLGDINDVARSDCDQLIRARGNEVFFASGKCDPSGVAYFSRAAATANPVSALIAGLKTHQAGTDRRGFPATGIDGRGNYHVAYGAKGTVYYNKYNAANARVFSTDKLVFSGLGAWHNNSGLCALAVSDNGNVVLMVALNPDGASQNGANAALLYSYSLDGGANWSKPAAVGRAAHAGEGRCRPALVIMGGKAFMFYRDAAASGTSLAILAPTPMAVAARAAPLPAAPPETYASWAAARLGNPAARGAEADPDGDGCRNADEFSAGTDPRDAASRP